MRATTEKDRRDIVNDVCEGVLGAGYEWLRHYQGNEEEGILNGADVRLVWEAPDVVMVELDGQETLRLRLAVTAEVLESRDLRNEPTSFILQRTWATVPSGWFVKTPQGTWWEVLETAATPAGQRVAMRSGGNRGEWTRDPDAPISVRRGTLAPQERDDALNALEGAFKAAILRDEPPMQS